MGINYTNSDRDAGRARWQRPAAMFSAATLVAGMAVAGAAGASGASTVGAKKDAGAKFLACEVTDTGGINDRSFNASAYAGLKVAAKAYPSIAYKFLSSSSTSDYTPNINTFMGENCGIIITVGYDMADATSAAAKAHPAQKFAIVDFTYAPAIKNVLGLHYDTDQDAFMGGYLAAAMSKSGTVGTFGGQDIPTVTIYMSGWVAGVRYYNKLNHADVKVLGWDPETNKGLFTNDFTNQTLGKTDAQTLMAEGADVIFPVAGSVGLGAAAAVKSAGAGHYMEWVDVDGCISTPSYCSLFLTSVTKGITASVSAAVESAYKHQFHGGNYNGTLANNGVSLSPFHDFASKVPAKVKAELNKIKAGIIAHKISVNPKSYPAS